jgi:aminopeptidase N
VVRATIQGVKLLSLPVLLAALALPAAAAPPATTQLPRTARPLHYDVSLVPDAGALRYRGRVGIDLEVLERTSVLTLHAADMEFHSARLKVGGEVREAQVAVDAARQTASFTVREPLAPGPARLELEYTGRIGTQAVGLFALDYPTAGGKRRALFTQFENSDARRMIPSWDEPSYKATFSLEAEVPAAELAVSNMPVESREPRGAGRELVRFQKSPKMSTYLLFFALGDLERATVVESGTEVGVVTKRGHTAQAAFALESSARVLREFNDYFGVPYPLPKLDNVAAPGRSQFFGAMENWGAIFSFEYILLLDPKISNQSDKQRIFETAAHEIAHQWFGNLVTMAWWDDLWLNEGFASWIEGRMTEKLHPEWNPALSAVKNRERAMEKDALRATHPVVQHVETVEQASQAFDVITYQKGEAVLRMLESYVGADAWREGVRRYIKRHAYGNTVTDDFWRAVEEASGQPIVSIAHEFTLQPGIPLVEVKESGCAGGSTRLTLVQREFSGDQPGKKPLGWKVPVLVQGQGGEPTRVLVSGQAAAEVPGCGPVVVNAGQMGYYRTLYPRGHFASLTAAFPRLAAVDQLGLLADAFALGMSGYQPASDVLDLVAATPPDADPQVWGQVATSLEKIHGTIAGSAEREARFRAFAWARLRPVFAQVGWTPRAGEPDQVAVLRGELIQALGALGDPEVVQEARRRYAAGTLPGPIRKAVMRVVARQADAATWDALRAAARTETTPLVRDDLYELLASAEDEALARRALELALTDEPGATNAAEMISTVAKLHPEMAFDFALEHLEMVNERVDTTSRSRYYARLAQGSADPALVPKLEAYAEKHLAPASRREVETASAAIAYRASVRKDRLPELQAWLERNVPSVAPLTPLG